MATRFINKYIIVFLMNVISTSIFRRQLLSFKLRQNNICLAQNFMYLYDKITFKWCWINDTFWQSNKAFERCLNVHWTSHTTFKYCWIIVNIRNQIGYIYKYLYIYIYMINKQRGFVSCVNVHLTAITFIWHWNNVKLR